MNSKSALLLSNHGRVAICSISPTVVLKLLCCIQGMEHSIEVLQHQSKLSVQDASPVPLIKGSQAEGWAGQTGILCQMFRPRNAI